MIPVRIAAMFAMSEFKRTHPPTFNDPMSRLPSPLRHDRLTKLHQYSDSRFMPCESRIAKLD